MIDESVIIPVYNAEKFIEKTVLETGKYLGKNKNSEFIFVSDGSKDKSYEIIKETIKKDKLKRIKLVGYSKNKGKGYAVRKGLEKCSGKKVAFIDADLAYSLDHIKTISKALEKAEVAIGCRGLSKENKENVNLKRKFIGVVYNILSRILLGLHYEDMQAGVKGFRKNAAKEIFKRCKINGFSFDSELIFIGKSLKFRIKQFPAKLSEAHKNQESSVKILEDSFKMLLSLFYIRTNSILGKYK